MLINTFDVDGSGKEACAAAVEFLPRGEAGK